MTLATYRNFSIKRHPNAKQIPFSFGMIISSQKITRLQPFGNRWVKDSHIIRSTVFADPIVHIERFDLGDFLHELRTDRFKGADGIIIRIQILIIIVDIVPELIR